MSTTKYEASLIRPAPLFAIERLREKMFDAMTFRLEPIDDTKRVIDSICLLSSSLATFDCTVELATGRYGFYVPVQIDISAA